jgi:hypothetical protein
MTKSSPGFGFRVLRYISQLSKALWLFFPGILFILFFIFCFWTLGQGKDLIVAFTENESHTILSLNYTRIIFFIAIGFWAYVSWYSSRIISYLKKSKQEDKIQEIAGIDRASAEAAFNQHKNYFELSENFIDEFPRMIGNACFLVIELAVLQSPLRYHPLSLTAAVIIFVIAFILLRYLNKWIAKTWALTPSFRKLFWMLLTALIVFIIIMSLPPVKANIMVLFILLILFHIVFIIYTNLRRIKMENAASTVRAKVKEEEIRGKRRSPLLKVMDFFCIPRKESGYFKWFLFIGICGIIFYVLAINLLGFARGIGPFPFIILAFGVLLAFGNIVTAFSVRYNVNFHFILFLLAFAFGPLGETHRVRTFHPQGNNNNYDKRPDLKTYLQEWLIDRNVLADSSAEGYDVYFVMANGGASRSGYWTAAVLGEIEDSTLQHDPADRFSNHVFCLSGTSGGGVGVAAFFGLLRDKDQKVKPIFSFSAKEFLKQDYFTYTFARMLGPDFFNYIFHISTANDRAAALERSFEISSTKNADSLYRVPFYDTLSHFPALKNGKVYLPILCVNTTRMQDGNPGVVTNLKLDSSIFNNRVDVLKLLKADHDISLTSGAILGARFPYLSPAGRIADNYFVDGGYFDNSGAGVVQEMIRGILNIGQDDSTLSKQIKKLHFKILHITNSPVNLDSTNIKKVPSFKNDLLAPILTIVGAYDMQTTVNDSRLINFINDVNKYSGNKADYLQIPLYKDLTEWKKDSLYERFKLKGEPSYAMNWFMSDTTIKRIDKRLRNHEKLDSLISSMNYK